VQSLGRGGQGVVAKDWSTTPRARDLAVNIITVKNGQDGEEVGNDS
jgi:hypothetical protein